MFRKMSTIAHQVKQVAERVTAASLKRTEKLKYVEPRLVAVSKTKDIDMIMEAYDAGQRHFGENYVNELVEKAHDIELQDHCEEIKWHFIGHLQSNKASKVLGIPNLFAVETVDSEKIAKSVNNAWDRLKKPTTLNIMVQVNTSGEANKNGIAVGETTKLVTYIRENCPQLKIMGLMTIGAYDYDTSAGPNPDFMSLVKERDAICESFNIPIEDLELSMGMSSDFEQAIEMGSTNVRVGSTIFGTRSKTLKKGEFSSAQESNQDSNNSTPSQVNVTEAPSESLQQLALS